MLVALVVLDDCTEGGVHLVGGQNPGEGRVEICLQGVWGTICDHYFDRNDANVVCRQLGLPDRGAAVYYGAYFGQGTGPFHIQYIGCRGSESDLLQCSRGTYPYCSNHVGDAGVRCAGNIDSQLNECNLMIIIFTIFSAETCDNEGEIRLAGGIVEGEGRVEICRGGAWGTVCDDYWGTPDATVVCRQLGFSTVGEHNAVCLNVCLLTANPNWTHSLSPGAAAFTSAYYGQGFGPIQLDNVACVGNENRLLDCTHTTSSCEHYQDAGVKCTGKSTPVCVIQHFTHNNYRGLQPIVQWMEPYNFRVV